MEDVKLTRTPLVLMPAEVDGFIVREEQQGHVPASLLFAGTLSHCLAFMESRMRPAEKVCAPESPGVVRAGDLTRGVTATDKPDAFYGDIGGVRRPTVSLEELQANRAVQAEWDAGVRAAARLARDVPFGEPKAKVMQDALRQNLIREFEVTADLPYRYRRGVTQQEAQIILAALRNMDAQNDGTSQKDFK